MMNFHLPSAMHYLPMVQEPGSGRSNFHYGYAMDNFGAARNLAQSASQDALAQGLLNLTIANEQACHSIKYQLDRLETHAEKRRRTWWG